MQRTNANIFLSYIRLNVFVGLLNYFFLCILIARIMEIFLYFLPVSLKGDGCS